MQRATGSSQKVAVTHHAPRAQGQEQGREGFGVTGDKDWACGAQGVHGQGPQRQAVAGFVPRPRAGVEDAPGTPVQGTHEKAVEHEGQRAPGSEGHQDRRQAVVNTENIGYPTAEHRLQGHERPGVVVYRSVGKEGQLLGVAVFINTLVEEGIPNVQVRQVVEVPVDLAHGMLQVSGEGERKDAEVNRAGKNPD